MTGISKVNVRFKSKGEEMEEGEEGEEEEEEKEEGESQVDKQGGRIVGE